MSDFFKDIKEQAKSAEQAIANAQAIFQKHINSIEDENQKKELQNLMKNSKNGDMKPLTDWIQKKH